MSYKAVVKIFREADMVAKSDRFGNLKLQDPRTEEEKKAKPAGKVLDFEVTASTQAALTKKINTLLTTLDDDE